MKYFQQASPVATSNKLADFFFKQIALSPKGRQKVVFVQEQSTKT